MLANETHGAAWALKGLCEYRLKNYDTALADLIKARTRGIGDSREITEVARYHAAMLSTRIEQYEQALGILADFGLDGNDSPRIIEAMGIATLRMPMLPEELPGDKREMVMMAGRARYFMSARMWRPRRTPSRRWRRAIPIRRTSTTRSACSCWPSSPMRRSRRSSAS